MNSDISRLSIRECFTYDLPQPQSLRWYLKAFLLKPNYQSVVLYRLSQQRSGLWAAWMRKVNLHLNGVDISPTAEIGKGLQMEHPVGIVVGKHIKAGRNLALWQHVTLGQMNDAYPTLGDDVTVYVGASVLGGVHVGDGAVIGAHALVLSDVPANTTVVGIPARPIGKANLPSSMADSSVTYSGVLEHLMAVGVSELIELMRQAISGPEQDREARARMEAQECGVVEVLLDYLAKIRMEQPQ